MDADATSDKATPRAPKRDNCQLVNEEALRRLINGLELGDPKRNECIAERWLNYVLWWDCRARESKRYYEVLRSTVVIVSAVLPALVSARALEGEGDANIALFIATLAASVVVAACAGLEGVFAFGDVWREKRAAAERIKIEGFRYFSLAAPYDEPGKFHADLYPLFAKNVEEIIEDEIGEYIAIRRKAGDGTKPGAPKPGAAKPDGTKADDDAK